MMWMIILFFLSAVARSLEQIYFWRRVDQSWLPEKVFSWDLKFLSTADAIHTYMGITLIGFGLAFYFAPPLPWYAAGGIIIVYYQVFNLFFHIVFIKKQYRRWPILKAKIKNFFRISRITGINSGKEQETGQI